MTAASRKDTNRSGDGRGTGARVAVLCVGNGGLVMRDGCILTHRSMAEFLEEIADRGSTVCFCHWREPIDDPMARTRLEQRAGLRVRSLAPVAGSPWNKVAAAVRALLALFTEVVRADFVYLFWPGRLSEIAARMAWRLRKPYGFYLRGGDDAEVQAIGSLLAGARFAIVTGGTLREIAQRHCYDVENVTPMTALRTSHLREPARNRQPGPWRVLYVGRVERSKGVHELVEACAALVSGGLAVELLLVGHCDIRQELLDGTPPPMLERIRFVDVVTDFEELADIYRASDVFVLPSHSEGFPRVLYEAMAFGVPIVTTFVGGIPSVMVHGRNCLRVEVGNAADLSATLSRLLADDALRLEIAQGGYSTISALLAQWRGSHALQILQRIGSAACSPRKDE